MNKEIINFLQIEIDVCKGQIEQCKKTSQAAIDTQSYYERRKKYLEELIKLQEIS